MLLASLHLHPCVPFCHVPLSVLSMNNMSFAEVSLSRDREARRRRCGGIVHDKRQRDRPKSPPPFGLRAQRPCFFVAPPRRCLTSTRRHASNQKPFRPQQMACYSWDRTLGLRDLNPRVRVGCNGCTKRGRQNANPFFLTIRVFWCRRQDSAGRVTPNVVLC